MKALVAIPDYNSGWSISPHFTQADDSYTSTEERIKKPVRLLLLSLASKLREFGIMLLFVTRSWSYSLGSLGVWGLLLTLALSPNPKSQGV